MFGHGSSRSRVPPVGICTLGSSRHPIFTSLTLNFGGSGGIVTPIFFIGSTAGAAFAQLFHQSVAIFSSLGLVSLLAGAANTPIAASILAVELFGPALAPYATVACVISFLMTGHRSVHPSQILAMRKSPSIQVELGKQVDAVEPVHAPRNRSLLSSLQSLASWVRRAARQRLAAWRRGSGGDDPKPHDP